MYYYILIILICCVLLYIYMYNKNYNKFITEDDLVNWVNNDWNDISKSFLEEQYSIIINKRNNNEYNMDKLYSIISTQITL